MESKFKHDLKLEQVLGQYLDEHLYNNGYFSKADRVTDIDSQYKGIDIIVTSDYLGLKDTKVDEKAAITYVNADIPTFALEVFYLKDGNPREGWLYDLHKETEYYCFIWVFAHPEDEEGKINFSKEDITGVRYAFVSRRKLISYLKTRNLGYEDVRRDISKILSENLSGKITMDHMPEGTYYCRSDKNLQEGPINVVIKRKLLWYLSDKKGELIGSPIQKNIKKW